jgi:hypothetical protein
MIFFNAPPFLERITPILKMAILWAILFTLKLWAISSHSLHTSLKKPCPFGLSSFRMVWVVVVP